MGELSKGSGISSIRGGDFELGASGISAVASSDLVVEDITPICLIPFDESDQLVIGVGVLTTTRSTTGTFIDRDDGLVKTAAIDAARFEPNSRLIEGASTNEALHNRDFTNAVHVKTTITAAKDAIGADGVANAASTLTATAGNSTVFQTVTKASDENTFSIDVRRKTGSGTIEISDDGGVGFTDITASINSTTYTRFQITTTQANPSFGLRIVTSGDEVEVDYEGLEALEFASSRIETTTTAVTRTSDNLSIDSANIPVPTSAYSISASVDILGAFTSGSLQQTLYNVTGETLRTSQASRANSTGSRVFHGAGGGDLINGSALAPNAISKLVTTFDQTDANFYIDAVSQGTLSGFTAITGTKTAVSIGNRTGFNYLFGHVKDFRIYDVALTDEQVEALS